MYAPTTPKGVRIHVLMPLLTRFSTSLLMRPGEIWGDMGRYGEIWGDIGRCTVLDEREHHVVDPA